MKPEARGSLTPSWLDHVKLDSGPQGSFGHLLSFCPSKAEVWQSPKPGVGGRD